MSRKPDRFDVAVVGAGHNGLATACLLARRGRRVVVLERRNIAGGLCAGEEFHPGFRTAGLLHDAAMLRRGLVEALSLHEHGVEFAPDPGVLVPEADGPGLRCFRDARRMRASLAAARIGDGNADAERFVEYRAFIGRVKGAVAPLLNRVPPDLAGDGNGGGARRGNFRIGELARLARHGVSLRRLGRRGLADLMRIPPMCVADWVSEWFADERLRAGLAGQAVLGTWTGPWSPGTASNLLHWECAADRYVAGGAATVAMALERAAHDLGVDIRTGAEVSRIVVSDPGAGSKERAIRATGVELSDGTRVDAGAVVSACDPKTTFLGLLPPGSLAHTFEERIRRFRARGTSAKVHLALSKPLRFSSLPDENITYARTGETLDHIERAFDPIKYRRVPDRPVLDVYVPSIARPELVPDGCAVVSVLAHFVPYDVEGGWTDERREELGDAVVRELARYAPTVEAATVGREVLGPADIEARYATAGGHIHHGEHALDQLVTRPSPGAARYATPIAGLFLCGSGSHPGGGVSGAPGMIAAGIVAGG